MRCLTRATAAAIFAVLACVSAKGQQTSALPFTAEVWTARDLEGRWVLYKHEPNVLRLGGKPIWEIYAPCLPSRR